MEQDLSVKRCAILADPRDPEKRAEIDAALEAFLPELDKVGIAHQSFIHVPRAEILPHPETDLFVVLGGDGTMIHFAGFLNGCDLPFYGLNYGNVGFMMNGVGDGLAVHARKLARGDFETCPFPLLTVRSRDLEGLEHEGVGLNDIYIQRMTPQSCRVRIQLDGQAPAIDPILCDGLVVATPLGSTAYNYNVTGSVVAINTPALTLTPVAAHRSCPVSCMMLPLETEIVFDILEPAKRRVLVVSDGDSHGNLIRAVVRVSPKQVRLCFDPVAARNLPMRFIDKALR